MDAFFNIKEKEGSDDRVTRECRESSSPNLQEDDSSWCHFCFLFTTTTVVVVGGVYLYVDVDDDDGEVNGVIMRRRTASHPKTLQGKEKNNSECR